MRLYRWTEVDIACDNLIPLSDGKKEQFNTECNRSLELMLIAFLFNNVPATFSIKVYPLNTINNHSEIKAILIGLNRPTVSV